MPLQSMTGFARRDGIHDTFRCHWEVRSVNGRGLDIRVRLPHGFEALEAPARTAISSTFSRGSISATLTWQAEGNTSSLRLNEANLKTALAAAKRIEELTGAPFSDTAGILNVRGVLEVSELSNNAETLKIAQAAALETLNKALADLQTARRKEGAKLETYLRTHLAEIEKLTRDALASKVRTPEAIQVRLREQVARLSACSAQQAELDADRLHQEAVLLATKVDVAEELDRLTAHIEAARDFLNADGPIGRKLDFLVQEFNREANTLCAKSNHIDVTRTGLAMKAAIDQFREQVQNVE